MTKMTYRNHQYMVYRAGNMFIAITTYGGRRIRAVAKCSPNDTFDASLGAQLAMARCAVKVEKIRQRNLRNHCETWTKVMEMANRELNDVEVKLTASTLELDLATENLEHILDKAR